VLSSSDGTDGISSVAVVVMAFFGFALAAFVMFVLKGAADSQMSVRLRDLWQEAAEANAEATTAGHPFPWATARTSTEFFRRTFTDGCDHEPFLVPGFGDRFAWCVLKDGFADGVPDNVPLVYLSSFDLRVSSRGTNCFVFVPNNRCRFARRSRLFVVERNGHGLSLSVDNAAKQAFPARLPDGRPLVYLTPEGEVNAASPAPSRPMTAAETFAQIRQDALDAAEECPRVFVRIFVPVFVGAGFAFLFYCVGLLILHPGEPRRRWDIWPVLLAFTAWSAALFVHQESGGWGIADGVVVLFALLVHVVAFGLAALAARRLSAADRRACLIRLLWLPPVALGCNAARCPGRDSRPDPLTPSGGVDILNGAAMGQDYKPCPVHVAQARKVEQCL